MSTSLIVATHVSLVVIPICFVSMVLDPQDVFLWHPTLMVIAFVFFMGEGVIVSKYIKANSKRVFWVKLHYYLQIAAITFACAGLLAILYHKYADAHAHFYTWHSWFGLGTLLATLGQALLGLRMHYAPRVTLRSLQQLVEMRQYHAQFGNFVYLFSITAIGSGIYCMNWHSEIWLGELFLYAGMAILLGLTLHIVFFVPKKTIRRVDNLNDDGEGEGVLSEEDGAW